MHNITSIWGELWITDNPLLENIEALENIALYSYFDLYIIDNPLLSQCDISNICQYLLNPTGTVEIYDNAPGCNSPEEVEEACETLSCLPNGITFTTQQQIDDFQTNYPGCTEIEGFVNIIDGDIFNLDGLSVLTSIWGNFEIYETTLTNLSGLDYLTSVGGSLIIGEHQAGNNLLNLTGLEALTTVGGSLIISSNFGMASLSGLDNLISIGGVLTVHSHSLTNLTGLENLSSIGGALNLESNLDMVNCEGLNNLSSIGSDLYIYDNESLQSLLGLENLTSIGGGLIISHNFYALTNISALASLDGGSIEDLNIYYNYALSSCEMQSICDYLASPNGTIFIQDNAPGCNNPEEVMQACDSVLSVEEVTKEEVLMISPNPCSSVVIIRLTINDQGYVNLDLVDMTGIRIKRIIEDQKMPGTYELKVDLCDLPKGTYFCTLKTNEGIQTKKMIKL